MADVTPTPGPVQALQDVLAAEHAAVWVLGFLGARVPDARTDLAARLTAAFETHRAARDELSELLSDRGATPVAAQPSYALPAPTTTPDQLEAAVLAVQEGVTRSYAAGVGGTSGADRRRLLEGLQANAVRCLGFGGVPSDLPGLA